MRNKLIRFLSKVLVLFKLKKDKKTSSTFFLHESNPLDLADKDLIDNDNISERDKVKVKQYTKRIINVILTFGCIWVTWSYILATYSAIILGQTETVENLSVQVCITIVGSIIAYCIKAFFETNAEKKNEQELLFKQMDMEADVINTDEEAVG